jgi:hypothetical protein
MKNLFLRFITTFIVITLLISYTTIISAANYYSFSYSHVKNEAEINGCTTSISGGLSINIPNKIDGYDVTTILFGSYAKEIYDFFVAVYPNLKDLSNEEYLGKIKELGMNGEFDKVILKRSNLNE